MRDREKERVPGNMVGSLLAQKPSTLKAREGEMKADVGSVVKPREGAALGITSCRSFL
jgi:hypothetical protein